MRKKIILWGLGSFSMLLLGLVLIAPTLIDSASLKQKIQSAVTQKKIGTIDYHKAYLSILPLPHLNIEKMHFSSPEGVVANVDNLEIYPELFPLIRGHLRLSEIVMGTPEFQVILPGEQEKKEVSDKESTQSDLSDSLMNAISPLKSYTSGLTVSIEQGRLELKEGGQHILEIRGLNLDADLDFTGAGGFDAEVNIVGTSLAINRPDKMVAIDCDRFKAGLSVNKEKVVFSLIDVRLAHPALKLSGQFVASPKANEFSFDLDGKDLDVKAIRAASLSLGGDNETLRDTFSYLKSGRIPVIHVQSKSKSLSALGDFDNIIVQGRLENSDISIDNIGMQLAEVEGDALITKGLLETSGTTARLGETTGHNGTLKLGLAEGNDEFHLELVLNTQLHEVPAVLKKIIDNETILHDLSLIKNVQGTSTFKLVLGEDLNDINTKIEVTELDLLGDYQRVPFPIKISSGKIIFSENKISTEGLEGSVGNSTFSETSCNVQWEKDLYVDIPASRLNLDLGELYPWISSFDDLKDGLADVKEVNGNIELSSFKLTSSYDINGKPEQWQLSANGDVNKVSINTTHLPESLHLSSGKIQVTPDQMLFKNIDAQLMDAEFDLTGTLIGDLWQPESLNFSLSGDLGEKCIHFLTQSGHLPSAYAVHAPVQFANTDFIWQSSDDFSFTGNLLFPDGVELFSDFKYLAGNLTVDHLDIKDQDSKASFALDLNKSIIKLIFNGHLHSNTLDRIFNAEKSFDGWLKGDFQVAFVKGRLSESSMKGQLEGGGIVVPLSESAPLIIDKLSLAAKNDSIGVNQLLLSQQENHVELKGRIDLLRDEFVFDLDAAAGDLIWDVSEKTPDESDKESIKKSGTNFWEYPVSGTINLAAKSFTLGDYTWQQVHAQISQDQDRIRIDVTEASLCGIDTLGTLLVDDNTLDLDFKCTGKDRDIAPDYSCLSHNRVQMTGLYEFSGQITAHGPADDLLRTAKGKFDFIAQNGQVTKDKKLSRILEVVNFTEIVKGRIPDLRTEGFRYDEFTIQGELSGNILEFKKLYMDGKTLDLLGTGTFDLEHNVFDVELLAAPFKTVDTAIKSIPGVNYLMAGNLVSIPVRVKGDADDPEVTMMSASDVSSGFLDFAKRAIKSPIKLIQTINPYKKSESE